MHLSFLVTPLTVLFVTTQFFYTTLGVQKEVQEMLTTTNLTKNFGDFPAVKGIDLNIKAGSFVALLGPNGSGKSTTISMLTGLMAPSNGQILFNGQPLKLSDYYKQIGVVFQNSVLDNELTVFENLKLRGKMTGKVSVKKVEEILEKFLLLDVKNQAYGTLSGGQKRRVDIVRALLHQPKILFLDEPTTGIDIQSRKLMWQLLEKLQKEEQLTIFLTTHYLEEVNQADYVYILKEGQVITEGTAEKLRQQHTTNILEIDCQETEKILAHAPESLEFELIGNHLLFPNISAAAALEILTAAKNEIMNFRFHEGTMDDVFLAVTEEESAK